MFFGKENNSMKKAKKAGKALAKKPSGKLVQKAKKAKAPKEKETGNKKMPASKKITYF